MGVTRTTRRSFPFFRRELKINLEELNTPKSVKEIAREIPGFFNPEISNILEIEEKQTLKNLRGRPEISNGAEVGREILLKIQGHTVSRLNQEKVPFEATVETKFKEFLEGAICYNLFSNIPEGSGSEDLQTLIKLPQVELTKLEVGLDFFENREFPFLAMKLQGLKERIYISISEDDSSGGSKLNGLVENNNLPSSGGFSDKVRQKLASLAQITGISAIPSS
jgi:hypothetical protein